MGKGVVATIALALGFALYWVWRRMGATRQANSLMPCGALSMIVLLDLYIYGN